MNHDSWEKRPTIAGFQLYDQYAGEAEVDLYIKRDATTFQYPEGPRDVQQQWVMIRRYVKGKLHSILRTPGPYKIKYIRMDLAVVAIPVRDGPSRRYEAVGLMKLNTKHHRPLKGNHVTH